MQNALYTQEEESAATVSRLTHASYEGVSRGSGTTHHRRGAEVLAEEGLGQQAVARAYPAGHAFELRMPPLSAYFGLSL